MFGYPMNTVLFVVGTTLGVVLFLYAVVYGVGARRAKRYRPGRAFEFAPVWFMAHPELKVAGHHAAHAALPAVPDAAHVAAAGTKGGASGKW
ncbi:hypothetical protein [Longispora albida]|uniref:aa3-type cytochrome oxidase subunit CtaJ n=1 Tax=Longispora albida TaxID=203523 RepID=UPI000A01B4D0|nr:hypothetical protein [Longispora albida]